MKMLINSGACRSVSHTLGAALKASSVCLDRINRRRANVHTHASLAGPAAAPSEYGLKVIATWTQGLHDCIFLAVAYLGYRNARAASLQSFRHPGLDFCNLKSAFAQCTGGLNL